MTDMTKPSAAKQRSKAPAKSKALPTVARGSEAEKSSQIAAVSAADGKTLHQLSETRHSPKESHRIFETGEYPYREKIKRTVYERQKANLQAELLKAQRWIQDTDQKVVILFEGRDAAGKGGTIKRFMEHLNPRGAHVVALDKPTEREKSQWYFQRYIEHLPTAGAMVLFDRSWYNRAGVERVMGFCSPSDYLEFMRQTPVLEQMLTRSGIRLFKYWFSVSREEQKRRFQGQGDRSAKAMETVPD